VINAFFSSSSFFVCLQNHFTEIFTVEKTETAAAAVAQG